ncbi:hypothetical protein LU699_13125 [Luteimonas fraxinea]|uniref:DUF7380 domain-containing protein n=1 Tax=Luteimonas fraxinea TaxID=2901869 RepID=A0ABS8UH64_9GAMM|nr:hypothetical protein [Luteimonas fraxinea]MCD9098044.1 hypothetical protein [Luteimonas fraxinea]UHH09231.1 hypothetical protein LU699_13125 [Luteimonas fraxinea]
MAILEAPVDEEVYQRLDWTSPAAEINGRHGQWGVARKLWEQAEVFRENGQLTAAQALRLLGGAVSMHMRSPSHAPFGSAIQMDGRRSASIEDLGEHDVALPRELPSMRPTHG